MTVKLLTEHHLEFLCLKGGCRARLSIHLSKCHINGNHMSQLKFGITRALTGQTHKSVSNVSDENFEPNLVSPVSPLLKTHTDLDIDNAFQSAPSMVESTL